MPELLTDVLRVAGMVVGGLTLYTLVVFVPLAWLGGRWAKLQPHRPAPPMIRREGGEASKKRLAS